jgi:hypothetical protein
MTFGRSHVVKSPPKMEGEFDKVIRVKTNTEKIIGTYDKPYVDKEIEKQNTDHKNTKLMLGAAITGISALVLYFIK